MDYIELQQIKLRHNGHWFDAASGRFFNSRYPQGGYKVGDKIYFITSEQFSDIVNHIQAPRAYTIRVQNWTTGKIDTVGEFNKLTKSQAQTALKKLLKAGS